MAKVKPDYSFVRGGLSLAEWLPRLVCDDRAMRQAAGEALEAMAWGVPSRDTDLEDLAEPLDLQGQGERFAAAVRAALGAPDFPLADFLRRLCVYRLGLQVDWGRRVDRMTAREDRRYRAFDRRTARLREAVESDNPNVDRAAAQAELVRLVGAIFARASNDDHDEFADAESASPAGTGASRVFNLLGPEFAVAPDALELLLGDAMLRQDALRAIARGGPVLIGFAPQLIRDLDGLAVAPQDPVIPHLPFDAAEALGSIGRGDDEIVEAMIARLGDEHPLVRKAASQVFRYMETAVCGQEGRIVESLWPMLAREDEWYDAILALASVGRHAKEVRRYVLDMAGPRPPRWTAVDYSPQHPFDATMGERGAAIDAMAYFADYSEECVPVLVEAMETFEEYDPDETYGGPQGRVARVLSSFGSSAGAAALPLARRLVDPDGDFPSTILRTLAAMGPAASAALPLLEAYREQNRGDEPMADLDAAPVPETDDPVGWAIQRIRGLVAR